MLDGKMKNLSKLWQDIKKLPIIIQAEKENKLRNLSILLQEQLNIVLKNNLFKMIQFKIFCNKLFNSATSQTDNPKFIQ